jgi:hypothetical protein
MIHAVGNLSLRRANIIVSRDYQLGNQFCHRSGMLKVSVSRAVTPEGAAPHSRGWRPCRAQCRAHPFFP